MGQTRQGDERDGEMPRVPKIRKTIVCWEEIEPRENLYACILYSGCIKFIFILGQNKSYDK